MIKLTKQEVIYILGAIDLKRLQIISLLRSSKDAKEYVEKESKLLIKVIRKLNEHLESF